MGPVFSCKTQLFTVITIHSCHQRRKTLVVDDIVSASFAEMFYLPSNCAHFHYFVSGNTQYESMNTNEYFLYDEMQRHTKCSYSLLYQTKCRQTSSQKYVLLVGTFKISCHTINFRLSCVGSN